MDTVKHDEIRDLIAKGWTPPPEALEPFRHLLVAFYHGMGWGVLANDPLTGTSAAYTCALIGMFDRLGLEIPLAEESVAEAA